jgi:hypothetical protein
MIRLERNRTSSCRSARRRERALRDTTSNDTSPAYYGRRTIRDCRTTSLLLNDASSTRRINSSRIPCKLRLTRPSTRTSTLNTPENYHEKKSTLDQKDEYVGILQYVGYASTSMRVRPSDGPAFRRATRRLLLRIYKVIRVT